MSERQLSERGELPIPDSLRAVDEKAEVARVWIADGRQVALLDIHHWDDPWIWGMLLADLARHLSLAYEDKGYSRAETLMRIKAGLDAELGSPTCEAIRGN